MLLQLHEDLEDAIVHILAENGPLSVNELQDKVAARAGQYSKQAIYKNLNKLEEVQIVTKLKTSYTLNIAWNLNMLEFAQRLERNTRSGFYTSELVPREGEKKIWNFDNVWSLHEFWAHYFITILYCTTDKASLSWFSLPWFELVHRTKKHNLRNALRVCNKQLFSLIGSDNALTRLCVSARPEYYFPSFLKDTNFAEYTALETVLCIDDFLLTVEFTQKYYNELKNFFESYVAGRPLDKDKVFKLFTIRTKIRVSLECKKKKASKYKRAYASAHADYAG